MFRLFHDKSAPPINLPLITPPNRHLFWAFGLVAGSWAICLTISGVIWLLNTQTAQPAEITTAPAPALKQFTSESEFRTYFSETSAGRGVGDSLLFSTPSMMKAETSGTPQELPQADMTAPERASETNVQVRGIDEPDIVKSDGKEIYVSEESRYWMQPLMMQPVAIPSKGIMPPLPQEEPKTHVIQALPAAEAKHLSEIAKQGELLLNGTTLMVLGTNSVTGFDVSAAATAKESWHYTLSDNRRITTSRLVDDTLVLVTELPVYRQVPCPLPLFKDSTAAPIDCKDVWHPTEPMGANAAYTVLRLDPQSGRVLNQVSFAGASGQTVVYVSAQAVYVTFSNSTDWGEVTANFLVDPANNLVTEAVKTRLKHVETLDISDEAKQVEVEHILADYASSMSDDERMKWEAERNNRMSDYVDQHKRELETTTIAKVDLNTFTIAGLGQVPGQPLNQFSLDEYHNNLRVATTVGGRGMGGGAKSANDVYILNSEMKTIGSVTDLGKEERIYAVRFMGDQGYVVTFKETDPLYTLDLSAASAPRVMGELKIPGFSSYLHPLETRLLLGVGKEENQVKVSLFDVSEADNPQEIDTYKLTDYWSDIQSTHHAFLQDAKHQVFFIPGEKGGYIFSYTDKGLTLVKTVENSGINRAIYINDNLYLVGNRKITIISENTWETVKTLEW